MMEVQKTSQTVWKVGTKEWVTQTGTDSFEIGHSYALKTAQLQELHAVLGTILTDLAVDLAAEELMIEDVEAHRP